MIILGKLTYFIMIWIQEKKKNLWAVYILHRHGIQMAKLSIIVKSQNFPTSMAQCFMIFIPIVLRQKKKKD